MIPEVEMQKIEDYNETIMAIQNKVKGGKKISLILYLARHDHINIKV